VVMVVVTALIVLLTLSLTGNIVVGQRRVGLNALRG